MIKAGLDITYGEYRLKVAEWAGVDPADVTGDIAAQYDAATAGQETEK